MCVSCENLPRLTLNLLQNKYVVNKEFTIDNLHSSTLNAARWKTCPDLKQSTWKKLDYEKSITQD